MQTTKQVKGPLLLPSTFMACSLPVQAIIQARQTSTLWRFYGLLYKL